MNKTNISFYCFRNIFLACLILIFASNAYAATVSHSTEDDFRKGVLSNGFIIKRNQPRKLSFSYLPDINDSFTTATSLPIALRDHEALVNAGYLFVLGGTSNGVIQSGVYSALIGGSGTLGSWQTLTSLPEPLENFRAVVYNGYIYVTGGYNVTSGVSNRVYFAKIDQATGTIGSWQTAENIPAEVRYHSIIAVGGYLYILGGYGDTIPAAVKDNNLVGSPQVDGNDVYHAKINADGTLGKFAKLDDLPGDSYGNDAIFSNGKITILKPSNIYQAEVLADGTLGTWTFQNISAGSNLGEFRVAHGFGAVFIPGCYDNNLEASSSSVYIGRFDSSGLCTWMRNDSVPLPLPLAYSSSVMDGEYLYVTGGWNSSTSTEYATVYVCKVNSTVNGELYMGGWTDLSASTPLPQTLGRFSAVSDGNNLWTFGGWNSFTVSDATAVYTTPVNANGMLGGWAQLAGTPLPAARDAYSAASDGNYVYIMGGALAGVPMDNVYSAYLNSAGTLGAWNNLTPLTPLPMELYYGDSVILNGYIYHIGGYYVACCDFGYNDEEVREVFYAKLNGDGTIGNFLSSAKMPDDLMNLGAVAYGNYLYVFGGDNGFGSQYVVYSALANTLGGASSWTNLTGTTPLPYASQGFSADVYNGFAVLCGMYFGNTVCSTKLNNDGTVAPFTEIISAQMPSLLKYFGSAIVSSKLYITGGMNGLNSTNTVMYNNMKLHRQPYQGRYSNLFDLGGDKLISTLEVFTTSHPTSTLYLRYRTASSATAAYSAWSAFTANSKIQVNTNARYIEYDIKVINTSPEHQSTSMSVDEVRLTYSAAPTVSSITPNSGNIGSSVDVTIKGGNFSNINSVSLVHTGAASPVAAVSAVVTTLSATNITVVDTETITCTFNLNNAKEGYYNLIVSTKTNTQGTLSSAFHAIDATLPYVTATPQGSIYNADTLVTLTSDKSGSIYYDLSSLPAESAASAVSLVAYTGPITITEDTRLQAYAIDSNNIKGNTITEDYIIRYQPEILASIAGDGYVYLSWEAESRVTFKLYYGTASGGPYTSADAAEGASPLTVSDESVLLSGLTNNTTYYLLLKSVDINGAEYGTIEVQLTPTPTQVTVASGTTQNAYRMISLPEDMSLGDYLALLESELGAYDNTSWRIFKYDPVTSSYSEYSDMESVLNDVVEVAKETALYASASTILGSGFWMITSAGLSVERSIPIDTDVSYFKIIIKPGWNQIGTPTTFEVKWQNVMAEDLSGNELELMNLYRYGSEGYSITDTLVPTQGYYVNNSTQGDVIIKIPADPNEVFGSLPYVKQLDAPSPPAPPGDNLSSQESKGCFIAEASYTGSKQDSSLLKFMRIFADIGLK